jgi:hypothetical protein
VEKFQKWALIVIGAAFVGSILWSIVFETLLPLVREGNWLGLANNVVGIPIILLGTAVIVYAGFVFVRDTFSSLAGETLKQNVATIKGKPSPEEVRAARRENMLILFRAWKSGLRWFALGFLLIAIGGFLINLS